MPDAPEDKEKGKTAYNILCAGGCGKVQGWTDSQAVVNRSLKKYYCVEYSKAIPRPMVLKNSDPVMDRLKALSEKIKAGGQVTPELMAELIETVAMQQKKG